jgi:photosystem II stability/assembly factor-like uncharacterized protein
MGPMNLNSMNAMIRSRLALLLLAATGLPATASAQEEDPNQTLDPAFLSALEYRMVGPHRGGRVTAVTGVPHDPHRFYMGSTGGGVWTSDDAGESWQNISDGQLEAGGIGAIAVASSDPNVIYVGTGSVDVRGNVSPGIGMYRSTDAGKTWSHVGLREAGQIGRIQVHPDDPDHLYVAALGNVFGPNPERGVFESRDGGETWQNILFVSDSTGIVDLSMDPSNPRILFAAAWRGERKPWTMISGSEEGGLYRSKDGGRNWQKLSGGLPQGVVGKIGVAVSPASPNRVWAIVEAEAGGMYRSDDGGDSWRQVSGDKQIYHRPWYYMHLTPDPTDENTVWVNNVLLYKSLDGGTNYTVVPTPHPDSHAIWINPNDTDIMVEGNDGGANVTLNGGRTWSTQRNQATAELYRVTVDNEFPYRLYGAQQDNSTVSVPSQLMPGLISDTEMEYQVGGCESGHIAVDPRDGNIIYAGCFGGSITRMDLRTGQQREILAYPQLQMAQRRSDLRYRFQWNAPIRISPHDSDVLYHTSQVVHRSRNGGQSWEVISPDLSTNNPDHQDFAGGPITSDGTGVEVYGTIFAFEESPTESGVLWAGSDDGLVHVSRDNGSDWTNVTPDGFPEGATVNTIDVSRHAPGRAYVTAYKYREADFRPYAYRTDDYGQSWTLLTDGTNGIPADHFLRVVREDPERQGLLYAGGEFGMYLSLDDGAHWQSLQRNLPVTPVTDIQVHEGDLVLSTQGRSFWIMDDVSPLRQGVDAMVAQSAHLFEPDGTHRVFGVGGLTLGATRRAQNPPEGAILHYSLGADTEDTVSITILDARGDTVKSFSSEPGEGPDLGAFAALAAAFGFGGGDDLLPKTAGLHRVVWDLRYPTPKLPEGTVIFGTVPAPAAPPGTYTATLTVGDFSQSRDIHLRADPRSTVAQADFDAQFEFLRRVGETIEQLGDRTGALGSARTQVQDIKGVIGDAGLSAEDQAQVEEAADSLVNKLTGVQEEIQQTRSKSFYDPLDYPGQLAAQLAYVYSAAAGGFAGPADAPPTDGSVERFEELQAETNEILGRLQEILDTELAAFNELLRSLDLDPVVVSTETRPVISDD